MNQRKLLLHERVEVRQFEEGLRGSWHTGVVVGISNLYRSVEYDELLCEKGDSKLIESISVSEAIEGFHSRRHVSSTYRGHIRPSPPPSQLDLCKSKLHFGVCVDAFFEDAWWEGLVFDSNDDANERSVFFPDEGDERKFNVSHLRVSRTWDEFLGVWTDRGVWVLVELVKELDVNVSPSNFIKDIWSHLQLNYGFMKMISEWTCGVRTVWTRYYKDVVHEIAATSSWKDAANHNIPACIMKTKGIKSKDTWQARLLSHVSRSRVQSENCGGFNIARSSQERGEKDPVGRIKEKRRPLRSSFGSKKLEYPLIYGVIENCIQGNNSFREELMTTDDSVLQSNALTGGGYDRMPNNYYGSNKKIKGRQCGMVKFLTKKPKSLRVEDDEANRFPDVMPRKNESIVPDIPHPQKKLNNQSIPRKRNLTKLRKIKRSYRQKHRTRKPSPVSESHRKHLITRKRAPNKFQQANAIVNLLTNKKEKGLDVTRTKDDSFVNQCQPAVHFENYGKNVRLKDMVSRPQKRKRRNYRGCQSDTVCMVCHIGGDLVFCDHCPCSYHLGCMGIKDIPDGKWFCPTCCCGLCGSRYSNSDNQHFTNVCLQCSREYHVDCLRKAGCLFSTDYPSESFCCENCYKLHVHIRQLLGISNFAGVDGLTWTILRWAREDCSIAGISRTDIRKKLSLALGLIHECFEPVIESHTRRDLARDVVFGQASKLKRLDFRGFCVMILQKGDEFVSVATLRILGPKTAELPLVATSFKYRRQGMCRLLVRQLEKLLVEMGVERLVLPAISQFRKTWETSFGFTEMTPSERLKLLGYPYLGFYGTVMLEKYLCNSETTKDVRGTSKELGRNTSTVTPEFMAEADKKGRFYGLIYKRKPKPKISGKENEDKGYLETMQTHKHVYKRRRILASRVS